MNTKSFPQSRIHYSNYHCMMGPSVVSCLHSPVLTGRSKACLFFAFMSRTELIYDVPISSIAITVTNIITVIAIILFLFVSFVVLFDSCVQNITNGKSKLLSN